MVSKSDKKSLNLKISQFLKENKSYCTNVNVDKLLLNKENNLDMPERSVNDFEENNSSSPRPRLCCFGNGDQKNKNKLFPFDSNISSESKDLKDHQFRANQAQGCSIKDDKESKDSQELTYNVVKSNIYNSKDLNASNRDIMLKRFKTFTTVLFNSDDKPYNSINLVDTHPSRTNFVKNSKDKLEANERQLDTLDFYNKKEDILSSERQGEINELSFKDLLKQNVIPLSARDIYCLGKSWKGISRKMDETGLIFITKFLEMYPHYTKFFKVRDGLPVPEHLQSQLAAENFMYAMDRCIEYLYDPKHFFIFVKNVGEFHTGIKNFKAEYLLDFSHPFFYAIKEVLGERYTPHIEDIYIRIVNYIVYKLIEAYEDRSNMDSQRIS
ncbi:unnamed protein product [Gordionus sp. m RMFG-2023]